VKALSGRELCRVLEAHGWQLRRIKGSHHVYSKAGNLARISVPVHGSKDLKIGLLRHLLRLADIDPAELE
jgi:predicted RNA binding protein YcfA (HicA-like mRNA interferase family)